MDALSVANLCYQVVDEMVQYINGEIEYDEVSEEVRHRFEQDYGIFHKAIVFWLKEQGELKEKVMSYKKTCQIYLKDCSLDEIEEFITRNANAYDYLVEIINDVNAEIKEQIGALGVARKLLAAK